MADHCIPPADKTIHPQAPAWHPYKGEILVDSEMRELLEELWGRGVDTLYSCQCAHSDQKGYILFENHRGAERFLEWAGGDLDHMPMSLFQRVRRAENSEIDAQPQAWEIWTTLRDQANQHWMEGEASLPPMYTIQVSVRFPYSDLPMVMKNVRKA